MAGLDEAKPEDVALLIDGVPHDGLVAVEMQYGAADALRRASCQVVEMPPLTKKGAKAVLMAGADVLVTGIVRGTRGDIGKPAMRRELEIESKACDVVESAAEVRKHGGRLKQKKLGEAGNILFKPHGVTLHVEAESGVMNLAWEPGARAFDVVESRARKAGLMLTGHKDGGIVQFKGLRGRHAGEFIVGGPDANVVALGYADSERGRFSKTEVSGQRFKGGQGADETEPYAEMADPLVGRYRFDIVEPEHDATPDDYKKRAEWEARRAAGGAEDNGSQLTVTSSNWRDADGKLWEPGFGINTLCPDAELDQVVALKQINLTWNKKTQIARITLVDPRSIGGKDPKGKSGKGWDTPSKSADYKEDS